MTQTMDLGEVGYKFSNEIFDLFATAFYTKYDNVGFTNAVFDLNGTAPRRRNRARPAPAPSVWSWKAAGIRSTGSTCS